MLLNVIVVEGPGLALAAVLIVGLTFVLFRPDSAIITAVTILLRAWPATSDRVLGFFLGMVAEA